MLCDSCRARMHVPSAEHRLCPRTLSSPSQSSPRASPSLRTFLQREKRKIVSEREKCSEIKPEWQRESVRYGERNTERKIDIDREAARKRRSEKNKEIEI